MKRKLLLVLFLYATVLAAADAETFVFKYQAGQQYRIISEVKQHVFVNGVFHHDADQLNRILVTVTKTDGTKGYHTVDYQNSAEARNPNQVYQFDRSYKAEFWRDEKGYYTIDPSYFVPTVRDVPVFPKQDIQPGETWSADGSEVHDLREGYNIPDAFMFTMPVSYQYVGKDKYDGKDMDLVLINYNIFFHSDKTWPDAWYPTLITGFSHQKMYWDPVGGRPYAYSEEYTIMLTLSDGQTVMYSGTASAHVEDIVPFDTPKATQDIQNKVDQLKLPDVDVRQDKNGVTLSIQNIQFAPDSAILLDSEKAKLDKIAGILTQYADRDLLITGFTAQAGYEQGRLPLSEDRARAVGQYLLSKGVRSRDQMMFQGKGDAEPIADNGTEAGRSQNRRVEITLLNQ